MYFWPFLYISSVDLGALRAGRKQEFCVGGLTDYGRMKPANEAVAIFEKWLKT